MTKEADYWILKQAIYYNIITVFFIHEGAERKNDQKRPSFVNTAYVTQYFIDEWHLLFTKQWKQIL